MQADDIMINDFAVVPESSSLQTAATLMGQRDIDVVAVQRGERIVGTLSHRNLAIEGCGNGHDPRSTSVAEVMTPRIVVCPLDADLRTVFELMREQHVDAVFVRTPSERVAGLVTRQRVLEGLACPDDEPRGPVPEHVKRVRGDAI